MSPCLLTILKNSLAPIQALILVVLGMSHVGINPLTTWNHIFHFAVNMNDCV